ncbi:MAG: NAD(P)H-dependent oxidoreductase subunit E [Deltaproteobacteria bacterium]|nr:NAD(P)H-dependent oxidoreductase subunit E [Deltaproteobacteria bacterium]
MKEVQGLFKRYPKKQHALLPILHLVMRENQGCVPEGWEDYVAELCETSLNHIRGVITFYDMIRKEPTGKFHIRVCTCVPCGMCGGDQIKNHIIKKLAIHPGHTTPDGLFSLEEVQCLAACDKAPLIQVNGNNPEKVTEESIDIWIQEMRQKG